jgi:ABC-type multidrug transport system permease subunit
MKNFKFVKPFSSFFLMDYNMSIKERWRVALHDPAYLLCWVILIAFLIKVLSYYII